MIVVFYLSAAVAIAATAMVLASTVPMRALLYLVVSLLAVALILFALGAPFVAALEVIVYAGAIMVLFVFVVMMLNLSRNELDQERRWLTPRAWIGPAILAVILIAELVYVFSQGSMASGFVAAVEPKQIGVALFGPYLLGVELASFLLLAGLVGALHLGRRDSAGAQKTGDDR